MGYSPWGHKESDMTVTNAHTQLTVSSWLVVLWSSTPLTLDLALLPHVLS